LSPAIAPTMCIGKPSRPPVRAAPPPLMPSVFLRSRGIRKQETLESPKRGRSTGFVWGEYPIAHTQTTIYSLPQRLRANDRRLWQRHVWIGGNIMAICFPAKLNDLASNANYSAHQLAELCRLTPRHIQRIFRQKFGRSPQDWLNEQRICAAKPLLLSGKSVKVVAFELGFKQPSHFCRQFKSFTRMTTSEFVSCQIDANIECRPQIPNVAHR
jgi:AraC-like DNA-binding protein